MAKKAFEIPKKDKSKPVLVQTYIKENLAKLFDTMAAEKELSRTAYVRELLEYCGREIMCGNLK